MDTQLLGRLQEISDGNVILRGKDRKLVNTRTGESLDLNSEYWKAWGLEDEQAICYRVELTHKGADKYNDIYAEYRAERQKQLEAKMKSINENPPRRLR